MKVSRALLGLIAVLIVTAAFVVVPGAMAVPPDSKVTFCHRTGSETNPYVIITTAESAWLNAHQPGANHPTLDGRDDIFLHFGEQDSKDSCDVKDVKE